MIICVRREADREARCHCSEVPEVCGQQGPRTIIMCGEPLPSQSGFFKGCAHLADLGFKQISVEPVVAQETDDYAIREEDLPQLFEEYDALAAEMVKRHGTERDFNFFHFRLTWKAVPCGKAAFRLRFGNGIPCGYAYGRFVSLPSVCRK